MESDDDDERSEGDGMDNWGEDNDEDDEEEEEESVYDAMMSLKMKLLWTNSSVLIKVATTTPTSTTHYFV